MSERVISIERTRTKIDCHKREREKSKERNKERQKGLQGGLHDMT